MGPMRSGAEPRIQDRAQVDPSTWALFVGDVELSDLTGTNVLSPSGSTADPPRVAVHLARSGMTASRAAQLSRAQAAVMARAAARVAQIATNYSGVTTNVSLMATTATKKTTDRSATAIRFPAELHEELRAAADERHLSINYLVVKAVEDFLERLIPADELKLTRD